MCMYNATYIFPRWQILFPVRTQLCYDCHEIFFSGNIRQTLRFCGEGIIKIRGGGALNSECGTAQFSQKNGGGGIFFSLSNSEYGTAQFSHPLFVSISCCSRYVAFVELIHLNDLIDNVLKAKFLSIRNFWEPNLCMV